MTFMLNKMKPEEVLAARQRLGKTQREMSYLLGVTERSYRRWERETGAPPTGSALIQRLLEDHEEDRTNVE